jgi:tRNA pseudouridine55 synthase
VRRNSQNNQDVSGYILLNKRPGISSFDSLGVIKKNLGTRKVGHAGTLDRFAQGLLIVLAGRATKLAPWFSSSSKVYRGTVLFGEETSTLDGEGEVIARAAPPSREEIERVLPEFSGDILQAPPSYSAVHVKGERAHVLARRGVALVMEKRPVTVYKLVLDAYTRPLGEITVHCSGGTYIRSLARDIALAAGSRGRLVSLTRVSIGDFSLEDAVLPDDDALVSALRPIDKAALAGLGIPVFDIDEKTARAVLHGRPLAPRDLLGAAGSSAANSGTADSGAAGSSAADFGSPLLPGPLGVFSAGLGFVGMLDYQEGLLSYRCVYAREESHAGI